jgi:molybdopterin-guanine dinucleotide biosynthesis protein A
MPLTGSGLFSHLLEKCADADAVIPVHGKGLVEPLCGVYSRSALIRLEMQLQEEQFSIMKLLQSIRCTYVDIAPNLEFYRKEMFSNLNSPADLELLS